MSEPSIIPEDSPLRKLNNEQLLAEVENLTVAFWNKTWECEGLQKQNNLFQETIIKMIDAAKVLRGTKGKYVVAHIINIVNNSLGKIKSNDYTLLLDDVRDFFNKFEEDESIPGKRMQVALEGNIVLDKMNILIGYSKLSEDDKKKVDIKDIL